MRVINKWKIPSITCLGFLYGMVNYTFKCNTLRKKEVHINLWYNRVAKQKKHQGEIYEL